MTRIEKIKQKMKEEYSGKVDLYFNRYEERMNSGNMDINEIETMLGDGIADAKDVLLSTTEELMREESSSKKKHVQSVEKQ